MSRVKRKIPAFRVSVMEGADYTNISNIPEVKAAVLDEVVVAIKEGFETNKKSISLFALSNTEYYIELERNQWSISLETALYYYVKRENYSRCIECRDLIKKLSYEQSATKRPRRKH